MALNGQVAKFDDLRSLAFGSITGTYAGVGSSFSNPVRLINIDNMTDVGVIISFNGSDDKIFIAAQSGKVFDVAANKVDPVSQLEIAVGERIYVKAEDSLPSSGTVYVTVLYADHA